VSPDYSGKQSIHCGEGEKGMKLIIAFLLTIALLVLLYFIIFNSGYPVPKGATEVKRHYEEYGFAAQDYAIYIKGRCTWDSFQNYIDEHNYMRIEDHEEAHNVYHSRDSLFTPLTEIPWWDYRWDDGANPPPNAYMKENDEPGGEFSAITFEKGCFYIFVFQD
jgi:hypothetical protein